MDFLTVLSSINKASVGVFVITLLLLIFEFIYSKKKRPPQTMPELPAVPQSHETTHPMTTPPIDAKDHSEKLTQKNPKSIKALAIILVITAALLSIGYLTYRTIETNRASGFVPQKAKADTEETESISISPTATVTQTTIIPTERTFVTPTITIKPTITPTLTPSPTRAPTATQTPKVTTLPQSGAIQYPLFLFAVAITFILFSFLY